MKQIRLKINSDQSLFDNTEQIVELYAKYKYLRVSILTGIDRSAEMNSKWCAMYKDLWIWGKFESFQHARSHCKLEIGIPILQRDCDGFAGEYKYLFGKLTYEQRLKLMGPCAAFTDGYHVTSRFTLKQGSEYIESILREFPDVEFKDK